jgi:hypothetical protein
VAAVRCGASGFCNLFFLTCERIVFDDWISSIALNGDFLATILMSRGYVVAARCVDVDTPGRVGRPNPVVGDDMISSLQSGHQ